MRFSGLFLLWSLILFSCAEPFEIGSRGSLLILDGKISTEIGESFIRIYNINEDGSTTSFNDFDIRVIDTDGQEYSFVSLDTTTNSFGPGNFGFVGREGVGYKVIATRENGMTLESTFDYVAEKIDFDFNIGDTTVTVVSQANEPIERSATSAIASFPYDGTSLYSRLDFEYRYMDFFSLDTVFVRDNDVVLFSCDDRNNCQEDVDVTAGFTTRFEWFFILRNRFCDSLASVTQINFVENCNASSMGCCEYRDDWPTIFKIQLESLSEESYAFWENLESLTSNNGLIFDTFPFPIEGNVECQGCEGDFFGLLRTSAVTTKEQLVIL